MSQFERRENEMLDAIGKRVLNVEPPSQWFGEEQRAVLALLKAQLLQQSRPIDRTA